MTTTRFSLIQWSDDTAAVDRTQFNDAFSSIDNLGAGYTQTSGAPAAASADKVGFLHFNTTDETLFYCDGTAWHQITVTANTTNATISAITPGDAKSAGASTELAKADHVHEMPAFGTISNLASSATASDGAATTFSRSDHVHGIPNSTITNDMLAGSINGSKLANNTITATQINANAVGQSELAADAVTGTHIADNAINSEHYVDGSIDRVHLAADVIDGTKIANDSINSEHYVDRSIDAVHIATGAITANELASNSVGAAEIASNAVGSSEIASGAVGSSEVSTAIPLTANTYGDSTHDSRGGKRIYISTSGPSGGSDGDIWLEY